MKFIILAYNPNFVKPDDVINLCDEIATEQECQVYVIVHFDLSSEPIYCVQLADTGRKS